MSDSCFVLSGRGLCDGPITRPEKSYRLCVCVCKRERERERSRNLVNEAALARVGLLRQRKKNFLFPDSGLTLWHTLTGLWRQHVRWLEDAVTALKRNWKKIWNRLLISNSSNLSTQVLQLSQGRQRSQYVTTLFRHIMYGFQITATWKMLSLHFSKF